MLPFSVLTLCAQEVLRGEVRVDLEPVYGEYVDVVYPLDAESAYRRALEESALVYSAMIYGWSFEYAIGERARGIAEAFDLSPLGTIPFGDPGLFVTDAQVRDMRLYLWTDYQLNEAQKRRMGFWKSGKIQTAQAIGHGPLGDPAAAGDWLSIKKTALEDAARAAVRAMLRGSERNRPKEARGYIGLAGFPAYWMDAGRWTASARFRVEIKEIIPFGAY
ncbi:MAG: hypothetical protein LBP88_08335 [Treponema sp.]|jgi:hypothetical protein|nr:hypothetical protein [Treponema sp.]